MGGGARAEASCGAGPQCGRAGSLTLLGGPHQAQTGCLVTAAGVSAAEAHQPTSAEAL